MKFNGVWMRCYGLVFLFSLMLFFKSNTKLRS